MKEEKKQQPAKGREPRKSTNEQASHPPTTADERDQRIKAEPDTERLRSERQSVIDGENKHRHQP